MPFEFGLVREAEVTGSFSFVGDHMPWVNNAMDKRELTLTQEITFGKWRKRLNKFLRFMLWPVGPKPLVDYKVKYTIPSVVVSSVNIDNTASRVSVNFRVKDH